MKSAAAIVVDGVLRKPVGGTPIPEGVALYHALCSVFNVILLRDDSDDAEFEHFLNTEQIIRHGSVIPSISWAVKTDGPRVMQVNRVRASGYAVELVVEPDPHFAAELYGWGFNVLHFMHAAYARPDWRPDFKGGQRSWDELVSAERQAAKLKAADNRMGSVE